MRPSLLVLFALGASPAWVLSSPPPSPFSPPSQQQFPTPAAAEDSARAELEAGRPWHAARILWSERTRGSLSPESTLLLARAEGDHGDWARARTLLEDSPWLDEVGGGEGWKLLGRSLEEAEEWEAAESAYARYLQGSAGTADASAPAVEVRRARVLAQAGTWTPALALLEEVGRSHSTLASWAALELAGLAADEGDASTVRTLLATVVVDEARAVGWDLEPRALLEAGDSTGAVTALERAVAQVQPSSRRAQAWVMLADLRVARGDSTAARDAYRDALALAPNTGAGARGARGLLEMDGLEASNALAAARSLERAGELGRALQAYDLYRTLNGTALSPQLRLARARLMARTRGRENEAVEEFTDLSAPGSEVGAPALRAWMDLRTRQGRSGDAQTLRNRLVERFPGSSEAAEIVFLRGDAAQDANRLEDAQRFYESVMANTPSHDRAGLSAMRIGQIHLLHGESAEAADVFESYLASFPEGRRWDEASYWAARSHLELGDSARARELLADIERRDPFGYYAVQAAQLRGEPYRVELPPGEEPPMPDWVGEGVSEVGLLESAGLEAGSRSTVNALVGRANSSPAAGLRLAEELIGLGYPLQAINLGFELRREGMPWSRRLLEVVYPFPQRESVLREAKEWGVDPLLIAALIRQESAWDAQIVSSAGAVGLMQVLPATGTTLARRVGPDDFTPALLRAPDVNLHLGTVYLKDLVERYPQLPLLLSAYNAGPHRAVRWKDFPEATDMLRFTERIPFRETRDYVKRVTRNRALYQALYGADAGS